MIIKYIKIIFIITLPLTAYTKDFQSSIDSFNYSSQNIKETSPDTVQIRSQNFYIYDLTQKQILVSIKKILNIVDSYILNGDGTSLLIPTENDDDTLTYTSQINFCLNKLEGYSLFANPVLKVKNNNINYIYCDISPIILKNINKTIYIDKVGEFSFKSLWIAWRSISNKAELKLYHAYDDAYLYKDPLFLYNKKQYYIKATDEYNLHASAMGYCQLKESKNLLPIFRKDSFKTVYNQEVVELNKYGNPISIKYYKNIKVLNTIICTKN